MVVGCGVVVVVVVVEVVEGVVEICVASNSCEICVFGTWCCVNDWTDDEYGKELLCDCWFLTW